VRELFLCERTLSLRENSFSQKELFLSGRTFSNCILSETLKRTLVFTQRLTFSQKELVLSNTTEFSLRENSDACVLSETCILSKRTVSLKENSFSLREL